MLCSDIGALIVAEMSSAGSLATGSYTAGCLAMAAQRTEVVAGLISQSRLSQVSTRGGNATPLPAPLPEPGSVMIWGLGCLLLHSPSPPSPPR